MTWGGEKRDRLSTWSILGSVKVPIEHWAGYLDATEKSGVRWQLALRHTSIRGLFTTRGALKNHSRLKATTY